MADSTTPCDSCGRDGEELVRVHRVYLDPDAVAELPGHDHEAPAQVVEEVERWCASCTATYPHVPD